MFKTTSLSWQGDDTSPRLAPREPRFGRATAFRLADARRRQAALKAAAGVLTGAFQQSA